MVVVSAPVARGYIVYIVYIAYIGYIGYIGLVARGQTGHAPIV